MLLLLLLVPKISATLCCKEKGRTTPCHGISHQSRISSETCQWWCSMRRKLCNAVTDKHGSTAHCRHNSTPEATAPTMRTCSYPFCTSSYHHKVLGSFAIAHSSWANLAAVILLAHCHLDLHHPFTLAVALSTPQLPLIQALSSREVHNKMIRDFFSLKCGRQFDHTRRNVAATTYAKHIMILKTGLNPAAELPVTRCCPRATWTWLMFLQNRFPGTHQLLVHIYIVSYCEQNTIEWERGVHLHHRKSIHGIHGKLSIWARFGQLIQRVCISTSEEEFECPLFERPLWCCQILSELKFFVLQKRMFFATFCCFCLHEFSKEQLCTRRYEVLEGE